MVTSHPPLPGQTTTLSANRVLCLAPHFDDEILGCGGLLIQLQRRGAKVHVLFVSDGAGGQEVVAGQEAYARRRRAEAVHVASLLGFEPILELGLPDGDLASHRGEIARGIRDTIDKVRPDLILAPSATEITGDHQGVFLALYDVLSAAREGEARFAMLSATQILLYEANRPQHPDLLVDVSEDLGVLREAIEIYTSQLERHRYLDAALGLRQYRLLSLPAEVRSAEAFRSLTLPDFTTRAASQLVAELGGFPIAAASRLLDEHPRVSVIVRTFERPALLDEALASLAASDYRNLEVVLVNDGGSPPVLADGFPLAVVRVDLPANEGRAAAANAGLAAATGEYISFLDDDDLVCPEHFSTLMGAALGANARVVYTDAAVCSYEMSAEGWRCKSRDLPYSRDFDPDFLLLDNYIPFHTLLIERRLALEVGTLDTSLPFFEDWDFLIRLSEHVPFQHVRRVTCEYRHFEGSAHHVLGREPHDRPDFVAMKSRVFARHPHRLTPDALARAVDRMRSETVAARQSAAALRLEGVSLREGRAAARRELDDAQRQLAAVQASLDAVEAEKVAALEERDHLATEVRRLAEEMQELPRTYAEIERLQGALEKLEMHPVMRVYRRLRGVS